MKQYLKSIERRLNLPRDIKKRVMDDFAASMEQRREAGQTDEEIRAELGSPKKVAAELNEQMKEYGYRKSPWRFLFLAAAVLSGGWLVWYWGLMTLFRGFTVKEASSIGIIGGADGPTAIFLTAQTSGIDWDIILMAGILALGIVGFLRLRKCRQK